MSLANSSNLPYVVAAFYKICGINDALSLRNDLASMFCNSGLLGTVIFSKYDGINGTVSGTRAVVDEFFQELKLRIPGDLNEYKESFCEYSPFEKMKFKYRPEIIKFGVGGLSLTERGTDLSSDDWAKLVLETKKEKLYIIDVRNLYEGRFGTFRGSIIPETDAFWQFRYWFDGFANNVGKDSVFAVFCTGGVRCEKAAPYMISKGFKNVFKLKGGVLQYFLDTNNSYKLWCGSCFVFDDRVAVDENSMRDVNIKCKLCNDTVDINGLKSVSRGFVVCTKCKNASNDSLEYPGGEIGRRASFRC